MPSEEPAELPPSLSGLLDVLCNHCDITVIGGHPLPKIFKVHHIVKCGVTSCKLRGKVMTKDNCLGMIALLSSVVSSEAQCTGFVCHVREWALESTSVTCQQFTFFDNVDGAGSMSEEEMPT